MPFVSKVVHVRWSGEGVWIPLGDLQFGVGYENHTSYPAPGQIILYPGGISETEIFLAYGGVRFASKLGQLAGNHFITLMSTPRQAAGTRQPVPVARRARHQLRSRVGEAIMANYTAPLADMRFALDTVARPAGTGGAAGLRPCRRRAGRRGDGRRRAFAGEIVAPLNTHRRQAGQPPRKRRGAHDRRVGKDAYRAYVDGGWNAVAFDDRDRRPGPATRAQHLRHGDVDRGEHGLGAEPDADRRRGRGARVHGTDELKRLYLAKLVSGEWTGIDESDRAAGRLRCRRDAHARDARGRPLPHQGPEDLHHLWRSRSDADNIVHMVLARSPDGPPGTAGLSLFLVPKYPGQRRRQPRRAQRCARASASSTSSASMPARPASWPMATMTARSAGWSARKIAAWSACSR